MGTTPVLNSLNGLSSILTRDGQYLITSSKLAIIGQEQIILKTTDLRRKN